MAEGNAKPTQSELYFCILTFQRNGYSAASIHQHLTTAHGDIISLRRTQEIVKNFKDGVRQNHHRVYGSGRPVSSSSDENVEAVKELVEENTHLSCQDICLLTGVPSRSVNRVLSEILQKKSVFARWVPHTLSDENKRNRVQEATNLISHFSERDSRRRTIIVDEKWVFLRDVPPKENVRYWVDSAGDRPKIPKRTISDRKFMWIMAANFSGDFFFEVLNDGGTVNGDRYVQFLEKATEFFSEKLRVRNSQLFLMHDNARPHVAQVVKNWMREEGVTWIKQPPYSPDFNLMDRFIFRNFETHRRGKDASNSAAVSELITDFLVHVSPRLLQKEFQNFCEHLAMVAKNGGDYM